MVSRGIWFCLLLAPQSVAVTAIGWESVAVKAAISKVGIGLGISGPLAVSIAKTSIAIAAIAQTKTVAVESTISEVGIGIRLGLSGPLAVVAKTSIAIAAIAQTKTIAVESTISKVSIGLGLGLSISGPLAVSVAKAPI